jgi:hypothetical protein
MFQKCYMYIHKTTKAYIVHVIVKKKKYIRTTNTMIFDVFMSSLFYFTKFSSPYIIEI